MAHQDENKVRLTEAEWRKKLTPEQFIVLRQRGTERAFSGKYYKWHEEGQYLCAACGLPLFKSEAKFDSGTGWPSFWESINHDNVELIPDDTHGMHRIEVRCKRCESHLGHLFDDGPPPTGRRFCINSECLNFEKE